MTTKLLYGRRWELIASSPSQEFKWTGAPGLNIDLEASVTKTSDSEPNELSLKVLNLNQISRDFLSQKGIKIELRAGYGDNIGTLFKGIVETVQHIKAHTEWESNILAQDGSIQNRTAFVSKTFKKGVALADIYKYLLNQLKETPPGAFELGAVQGLDIGFVDYDPFNFRTINKAYVAYGNVTDEIQRFARNFNLELYVNDGEVHSISAASALNQGVILLNQNSGLIGRPESLDDKRAMRFVSLLRHEMNPGVQFEVQAQTINGDYKATQINHMLNTRSTEWHTEIEGITL